MKTKNFYLIDSPKINELKKEEKEFLQQQLTIYHTHSSTVIDKAKAIYALVDKDGIKKLRFEYNAWLFNFVNYQLKAVKTEGEHEVLKKILAFCYRVFGAKSHNEGNSKDALDNYKKAISILEKLNDSEGIFKIYYNIALIHHVNGNLSDALKLYEKCVELGREIEDKTILALVFNNLYVVLRDRGNFLKSLNYLHKALDIHKENNDKYGVALSYHNIADSLQSQLEIEEALKYYLAALKLSESIDEVELQIHSCVSIGTIYQENDKNDDALKYYLKAVNLPQINRQPNYAYLKIGTLYESQNKIDLALEYYNKSLQLSERIEFKELLSETLSKIGALEIKRGNIEKATLEIERAFELAQELNNLEPIKEAVEARVFLALAIEDYKLAYKMEKLKNETNEKILNKENIKAVIKHQLKHEYEEQLKQKDIEIEKQKQTNQHLQEQIDLLSVKNKQLAYINNK